MYLICESVGIHCVTFLHKHPEKNSEKVKNALFLSSRRVKNRFHVSFHIHPAKISIL